MAADIHIPLFRELIVVLATTAVLVPVLARLRVNPVLGFLLAGALIGPYGLVSLPDAPPWLSWIAFTDLEGMRVLGEMGIVFLLFMIGLEMAPPRLWAMRRLIFGLGTAQVVVCGAAIGLVAWLWGNGASASIVIGASLALSSTAVVMKIIMDRHHFSSPVGQTSFSILLLQDLAVVPLIFLITLLGQDTGTHSVGSLLGMALLKAVGVIVAILLAGRFIARPVLKFVTSSASGPEFFMAHIMLVLLLAAAATGHAGLSLPLGAFLTGIVFAETAFRNQIEVDFEPFKGLFMGLFFIFVGMSVNIGAVAGQLGWIAASVAGLIALKAVLLTILCRLFRLSWPVAARTGLTLGQGGEFAFVLLGMAAMEKILPADAANFMIMVATLSLVVTPFLYRAGEMLEAWGQRRMASTGEESAIAVAEGLSNHVVIAGFGRTGQGVADVLDAHQIPYLALDMDAAALENLRKQGRAVFFGDAAHSAALEKVHAIKAKAIVLALDDGKASQRIIENIRHHCPAVAIYARARDDIHADELKARGVSGVILETVEMSLQLSMNVLRDYEFPPSAIRHIQEQMRRKHGDSRFSGPSSA